MSNQSIQHIQLAIIPLDGTVFDLNKYRYNYTRHYCESHHIAYSQKEFYQHLSNMYDMYKDCPMIQEDNEGLFNARIERELMQYLTYKGLKPKEGFLELLEYLHQKNIPVAILSTHRTKDAVTYLKMAQLYHKVQYIIGSDTTSMPLPSSQMLQTIIDHFHVKAQNTLVISSFQALNKAAFSLHMPIIFCEDLQEAQDDEQKTSYKICHNLFEVLNHLLFDRYNEMDMYSSLLGMNSQMSQEELTKVKNKWEKSYPDDLQLAQIIEQTYAYHLSALHEQNIKDASVYMQKTPSKKTFSFEDDDTPPIVLKDDIKDNTIKQSTENDSLDESFQKQVHEDVASHIETSSKQESPTHSHTSLHALNQEEEKELTALFAQINKKSHNPDHTLIHHLSSSLEKDEYEEDSQWEDDDDMHESPLILRALLQFVYSAATSFLIIFIGIIIYIALIHQFESQNGIFMMISMIFQGYEAVIEACFRVFFDGFHSLISWIPSYQSYLNDNQMFSFDGVQLLNIFIFQTIVIGLIKILIYTLRRDTCDE